MFRKLKTRLINCQNRNRQVEVTYAKTGGFFSSNYDIVSCPAMYDSGTGCRRECKTQLTLGSGFEKLQYQH